MSNDLVPIKQEYWDIFDKSTWGSGEWQDEPDKITWINTETRYPCIILRSSVGGNLNGYVGIPVYHPAYGVSYNGSTQSDHDRRKNEFFFSIRNRDRSKPPTEVDFSQLPEEPVIPYIGDEVRNIQVHGGLTFSGEPISPDKEWWETYKERFEKSKFRASIFPRGDDAEWMREWGPVLGNYEAWLLRVKLTHIYIEGSYEEHWYFGFDCAHAFDLCPKIKALLKDIKPKITPTYIIDDLPMEMRDVYRNVEYVENECNSLAQQLKQITVTP